MPGFALDTNVVSELIRRHPDPHVLRWLEGRMAGDLFLPALVLGELVRGVHRLRDDDPRQARYETWIERDVVRQFRDRILAFDAGAARIWGEIVGSGDRVGAPKSPTDSHIAAVVRRYGLILATRNGRHFQGMGVEIVNPWTG